MATTYDISPFTTGIPLPAGNLWWRRGREGGEGGISESYQPRRDCAWQRHNARAGPPSLDSPSKDFRSISPPHCDRVSSFPPYPHPTLPRSLFLSETENYSDPFGLPAASPDCRFCFRWNEKALGQSAKPRYRDADVGTDNGGILLSYPRLSRMNRLAVVILRKRYYLHMAIAKVFR